MRKKEDDFLLLTDKADEVALALIKKAAKTTYAAFREKLSVRAWDEQDLAQETAIAASLSPFHSRLLRHRMHHIALNKIKLHEMQRAEPVDTAKQEHEDPEDIFDVVESVAYRMGGRGRLIWRALEACAAVKDVPVLPRVPNISKAEMKAFYTKLRTESLNELRRKKLQEPTDGGSRCTEKRRTKELNS